MWHYAGMKDGSHPVCPTTDMYCYMLNTTNCAANPNKLDGLKGEFMTGARYGEDPVRLRWLVEYMTRIQSWLHREVYEYYSSTHIQVRTLCSLFHVRRSDIKGHGKCKYHKIEDYIRGLETKQSLHKNILLLTDDQNAIKEAETNFPGYNWTYFNRTRSRGNEGGWENHMPSKDPKLEVITILATFRTVRMCDSFAFTKGSFASFLLKQMHDEHGEGKVVLADLGY